MTIQSSGSGSGWGMGTCDRFVVPLLVLVLSTTPGACWNSRTGSVRSWHSNRNTDRLGSLDLNGYRYSSSSRTFHSTLLVARKSTVGSENSSETTLASMSSTFSTNIKSDDDVMDKFQMHWNQYKETATVVVLPIAPPELTTLTEHSNQIVQNIVNGGDVGNRGEIFVISQIILSAALLMGSAAVPLSLGPSLELALGPACLALGLALGVYASVELGPSLSPWPVPANIYRDLVVTGVYGYVRHPIYAGLLALALGVSLTTHSSIRLVCTALLWYVLERQSEYEEDQLQDIYPEYRVYRRKVKGKFVPQENLWAVWNDDQTSKTDADTNEKEVTKLPAVEPWVMWKGNQDAIEDSTPPEPAEVEPPAPVSTVRTSYMPSGRKWT